MFCLLSSCAPINFDEDAWKEHLMEQEKLRDIAPTFFEVQEANRKDRSKITYNKKYF